MQGPSLGSLAAIVEIVSGWFLGAKTNILYRTGPDVFYRPGAFFFFF
jgi:hypothetical protein